ncbi:DUF4272 domain-containing protein [Catenulispora rubra]|uniref:DUF4272 domain-containing protein n=1 Tax=Catenulispora rubra TaxID=280293 RepID=UPI00189276D8|nr:DUF4272 domain-containing protein [Catenulispora rubra]
MTVNSGAEPSSPTEAESRARKARSEARLAAAGISVPDHLPWIGAGDDIKLRTPTEAAQRAYALFLTAMRADALLSDAEIPAEEMRERFPQGFAAFSPIEAAFFAAAEPEKQTLINSLWRYESLAALQWALGWAEELPWPTTICDLNTVITTMMDADPDPDERIATAALRPAAEILDALDLHFRLHWATRHAGLEGRPNPADLDGGVIMERHYALNWLITFMGADWDDVPTHT